MQPCSQSSAAAKSAPKESPSTSAGLRDARSPRAANQGDRKPFPRRESPPPVSQGQERQPADDVASNADEPKDILGRLREFRKSRRGAAADGRPDGKGRPRQRRRHHAQSPVRRGSASATSSSRGATAIGRTTVARSTASSGGPGTTDSSSPPASSSGGRPRIEVGCWITGTAFGSRS